MPANRRHQHKPTVVGPAHARSRTAAKNGEQIPLLGTSHVSVDQPDVKLRQATASRLGKLLGNQSLQGLLTRAPTTIPRVATSGVQVSREEHDRDPDEVAAEEKEDHSIESRAKRGLASNNPEYAVHEVVWRIINNHRLATHFELNGSRYLQNQKGVTVELSGKNAATTGTIVAGDELLRQVANGQLSRVIKEIGSQIERISSARDTVDYVFIMGTDKPKTGNPFYREAKKYFRAEYAQATMVESVRDLSGINSYINAQGKPVGTLIIVSHAHEDGTLQFSLDANDKSPGQLDYAELKKANNEQSVTTPKPELVGFWTNVLIRGCNLGRSEAMLQETRRAFGGHARVMAPTHAQGFANGKEFMGDPYYEEPGVSKLSNDEAFARIKAKPEYSFITDWKKLRSKLKRTVNSRNETVYDGLYPQPGQEMAFLRAQQDVSAARAKRYTFGSQEETNDGTVFKYLPKNAAKDPPLLVTADTPPNNRTAIKQVREYEARPDAYAYDVKIVHKGLNHKVIVTLKRTEWVLHHTQIQKNGKGFDPTPGTKPWYGDTH